jgi:SnoaL-like polyketide cyclase
LAGLKQRWAAQLSVEPLARRAHRTMGGRMAEDHKARIREFIDRVLTAGESDATGDYFHDDMVEAVPLPGQGPGREGLKETLTRLRQAFPDMHWSIEENWRRTTRSAPAFAGPARIRASSWGCLRPTAWSQFGGWSLIGLRAGRSNRPACSGIP